MEKELLELEQAFWLGGAEAYEQHLAAQSLMVFPAPAGILDRGRTLEAIAQGPRWKRALIAAHRIISPVPDTAVLAYEVTADRGDGASPYKAHCSSCYVRVHGAWKLALHQQTPAA